MSDRNEWERDAVVWLAGRRIEAREGGGPARHAGFDRWRAAAEREAGAARFAERVRARVATVGRGVRRIDQRPGADSGRPSGALATTLAAARGLGAAPLVELGVAAGTGRELLDEACEVWVALPADLPAGRYVAIRVVGDSMVPLLHSGDVVLVDLDGAVAAGAVAVARHPEHGYVVKRVATGAGVGACRSILQPGVPEPAGWRRDRGRCSGRWCFGGATIAPSKPRLAPAP